MKVKATAIFAASLALLVALPVLNFFTDAVDAAPNPLVKQDSQPFGGAGDMEFAKKLWSAMEGYQDWKLTSPVYKGGSPHGKFVRLYSTFVTVDGRAFPIIIKDNYGGRGVTVEKINEDPAAWHKAVTIMLKREEGYDSDTQDWFWAKYAPDGSIEKNPAGMSLAGRVAKGMPQGCISCHSQAAGNDFLYSND